MKLSYRFFLNMLALSAVAPKFAKCEVGSDEEPNEQAHVVSIAELWEELHKGRDSEGGSNRYLRAASTMIFSAASTEKNHHDRALVDEGSALFSQTPNKSNGYFSDPNCDFCGGVQILADNVLFTSETTFRGLKVWGGYYPRNIFSTPKFRVLIHQDNNGSPGAVIRDEVNIPACCDQTGVVLFGVNEYICTLPFSASQTLLSGVKYWFEIINDTTGNTDSWFWETGDATDPASQAGFAFALEYPGVTWYTFGSNLAWEILETTGCPPKALCLGDLSVDSDGGCANKEFSIDNGSFDPNGDTLTCVQSPAGPYPIGESTKVTLTCTDSDDLTASCTTIVTVNDVDSDGDGVLDCDDLCPETVIPEAAVPSETLGINRWALTGGDGNFVTVSPSGEGPDVSYSIEDTHGCSCEQIIEFCAYGNGLKKFGCPIGVMDAFALVEPYCEIL